LIRHIVVEISPDPSLPVQGQEKDTKEGEFLPFVKGGEEGFGLRCISDLKFAQNGSALLIPDT